MSKISVTIEAADHQEFRTILLGLLGSTPAQVTNTNNSAPPATPSPAAAPEPEAKPKAAAKGKPPAPPKEDAPAAPAVTETKPAPAEKAAPVDVGGQPGLPDHIRGTNSMRDLLTYLVEHGADSADAVVASCVALKKEVPILTKVPNVEDRVRRALEVLDLFPKAADEADAAE